MNEIWKDIENYEGLYQISNLGNVKALPKYINNRFYKENILKTRIRKNGYIDVGLRKNAEKQQHFLIHRLVASAFIPNPNNLPEVNHKDENRENNVADNLEWCNIQYNNLYGKRLDNASCSCKKPILQLDSNLNIINRFDSAMDAERNFGFNHRHISLCCNTKRKTHGGFYWKYDD